jgi:hypothetical protein
MNNTSTFRYSKFYFIHPLIGIVFFGFLLLLLIYQRPQYPMSNYQLIPWTILMFFVLFSILQGFLYFYKRLKLPIKFIVSKESLSAIYNNGRVVQLLWNDIETIRVCRERWRIGSEVIKIISKGISMQILCNNHLNNYQMFKNTIIEFWEKANGVTH